MKVATPSRFGLVLTLAFVCAPGAQASGVEGDTGGCPIFEPAQVQALFPAATKLHTKSRAKPYMTCTFTWASTAPERRTIGSQVIESPGQGRLTLTRAEAKSVEGDWQRVLKSYGDETLLEVAGIGDRAVWSARRSQVSAQNSGFIVHVALSNPDAPDELMTMASRLAGQLLEP